MIVYCFGDSLTYGTGSGGGTYPQRLGVLLGSDATVVNQGIAGQTTSQLLARLQADVLDNNPDYVLVWGGINDIYQDLSIPNAKSNLQAIFDAIHNAGAKVVSLNITPSKGGGTWTPTRQTNTDDINSWILNTATNIDFRIDAYTAVEDPGNPDYILAGYDAGDGLHLQQDGYYHVAETVFKGVSWISADYILDQFYIDGNTDEYYGYPSPDKIGVGQGFIPTLTGKLTKISLELKKNGSPTNTSTLYLYSDNGSGVPNTSLATLGTLDESTIGASYGWIDILIPLVSAPTINSGTRYHIVVKSSGSNASNYIRVHANGTGAYTGGQDNNVDSVGNWTLPGGVTTWDINFKQYIDNASSPSSSTSLSPSISSSLSPSASTSPSQSESLSASSSISPSSSVSNSPSTSISYSQAPGDGRFSKQSSDDVPMTKDDLAIPYGDDDDFNVSELDGHRVSMIGLTPSFLLHQYKFTAPNKIDDINIKVNLRSTLAPALSTVFLQIWNVAVDLWEIIDFDDSTLANVDFDLEKTIDTLKSNYIDDAMEIAIRVRQENLNL